jgi:hypothetical protein
MQTAILEPKRAFQFSIYPLQQEYRVWHRGQIGVYEVCVLRV